MLERVTLVRPALRTLTTGNQTQRISELSLTWASKIPKIQSGERQVPKRSPAKSGLKEDWLNYMKKLFVNNHYSSFPLNYVSFVNYIISSLVETLFHLMQSKIKVIRLKPYSSSWSQFQIQHTHINCLELVFHSMYSSLAKYVKNVPDHLFFPLNFNVLI